METLLLRAFGMKIETCEEEWTAYLENPRANIRSRFHYTSKLKAPLLNEKLAYYGWKCRYCGVFLIKGVNLTWDHAIPTSRGGTDDISNLLPCCPTCNAKKGAKSFFEFLLVISKIN